MTVCNAEKVARQAIALISQPKPVGHWAAFCKLRYKAHSHEEPFMFRADIWEFGEAGQAQEALSLSSSS
jgi:hypothetical protein